MRKLVFNNGNTGELTEFRATNLEGALFFSPDVPAVIELTFRSGRRIEIPVSPEISKILIEEGM